MPEVLLMDQQPAEPPIEWPVEQPDVEELVEQPQQRYLLLDHLAARLTVPCAQPGSLDWYCQCLANDSRLILPTQLVKDKFVLPDFDPVTCRITNEPVEVRKPSSLPDGWVMGDSGRRGATGAAYHQCLIV